LFQDRDKLLAIMKDGHFHKAPPAPGQPMSLETPQWIMTGSVITVDGGHSINSI
jgi:FKBP-type peptidyl-prolyl cis-trans isomerase 2